MRSVKFPKSKAQRLLQKQSTSSSSSSLNNLFDIDMLRMKPTIDPDSIHSKIPRIVDQIFNSFKGELKEHILEHTFLTGGCFASLMNEEKVNDYDFYFDSKESVDKFISIIEEAMKNKADFTDQTTLKLSQMAHKTENAISFSFYNFDQVYTIQFITRFYGTPAEVTSNFDFAHTMNYYVPKTKELYLGQASPASKTLEFNHKASHPVHALKRLIKFTQRGYSISDDQLIKMAITLAHTPMDTLEQLRPQLISMYGRKEHHDIDHYLAIVPELKEKNFKSKLSKLISDEST